MSMTKEIIESLIEEITMQANDDIANGVHESSISLTCERGCEVYSEGIMLSRIDAYICLELLKEKL